MNKLVLLGMAVLFAACAMPQGSVHKKGGGNIFGGLSQTAQTDKFVDEAVEVGTDPAGARVQINGGLVGVSPVKVMVRRYWRGDPGSMTLDPVTIEALAAAPGQCDQSGIFGEGSRKVPSPVRFSMTSCSAALQEDAKPAKKRRK
jgi:hypothetical protein